MTEPANTSDPVRWGFLGAGNIATKALGPAVRASYNGVLTAVAARDVQRAQALGATFGPAVGTPVTYYSSYEALVADPAVEAVYISLPNDAHKPWTEAALAAGKHVLCEKPLGARPAEVDSMTAAAEAAGRHLVEASWYRWHPRVRLAQQLLAEGAIGTVRHVTSVFTFDGVAAGNYRLDPSKGGGALYDIGHYALSGAHVGLRRAAARGGGQAGHRPDRRRPHHRRRAVVRERRRGGARLDRRAPSGRR